MNREAQVARTFVELADTLVDDFDVVDLLARLAHTSVDLFGVKAAGLVLYDQRGRVQLMAATSEDMEMLELFQIQNDEGPCHDCCREGAPVISEDLGSATARWPRFVPVALNAGFRSAHALPMRLRRQVIGALNLFGDQAIAMDDQDVVLGQALADVATIVILQYQAATRAQTLADQLHLALNTRVSIEQAKGILSERLGVGVDDAFARMRAHARARQRLLADVVQDVIDARLGASDFPA